MPEVIEDTDLNISQDGEHDKLAHYVDRDEVMEAFVYGVPVIALCGKIWIPTRDGSKHKICPTCKEIYDQLS
jgi:hypothetical protein